jgi:hypothetical protein
MRSLLAAPLVAIAFVGSLTISTFAYASCDVDVVVVKGRVEHAANGASVRVQLIYPKQLRGESGEDAVENNTFQLQIPFLTQSRAPVFVGKLLEKCDRKPKTVVVTLVEGDPQKEYDRVSLDFAKDFKMADPTAYILRSEIVLRGQY